MMKKNEIMNSAIVVKLLLWLVCMNIFVPSSVMETNAKKVALILQSKPNRHGKTSSLGNETSS